MLVLWSIPANETIPRLGGMNMNVAHLETNRTYSGGIWGELESEWKTTHPPHDRGGDLPALCLGTQPLACLLEQIITQFQKGKITGLKGVAWNLREGGCAFVCLKFLILGCGQSLEARGALFFGADVL